MREMRSSSENIISNTVNSLVFALSRSGDRYGVKLQCIEVQRLSRTFLVERWQTVGGGARRESVEFLKLIPRPTLKKELMSSSHSRTRATFRYLMENHPIRLLHWGVNRVVSQ